MVKSLPPELLLTFLGFLEKYSACRPAVCKMVRQSQLGKLLPYKIGHITSRLYMSHHSWLNDKSVLLV